MNLKLEKEQRPGNPNPWYRITMDDNYVDGSYDFETISKKFEEIKSSPALAETRKEILKSAEI